jgi:hypothetical protein
MNRSSLLAGSCGFSLARRPEVGKYSQNGGFCYEPQIVEEGSMNHRFMLPSLYDKLYLV